MTENERWALKCGVNPPDKWDRDTTTLSRESFERVRAVPEGCVAVPVDLVRRVVRPCECFGGRTDPCKHCQAQRDIRALLPPAEPELKPCPFCGASPHQTPGDDDYHCATQGCQAEGESIVPINWNRRVGPSADDIAAAVAGLAALGRIALLVEAWNMVEPTLDLRKHTHAEKRDIWASARKHAKGGDR